MANATTANPVQRALFATLLEHVAHDPYPSATMMGLIEGAIGNDEELRRQYVAVLLDKIAADRFPSVPMMQRVLGLAG